MVWIIQTRLRLTVCNKEVNNVTMNNLFFMQCRFHTVAWCCSISHHVYSLLNLTKSDSSVNHMTIKKERCLQSILLTFNMHYETLLQRELKG